MAIRDECLFLAEGRLTTQLGSPVSEDVDELSELSFQPVPRLDSGAEAAMNPPGREGLRIKFLTKVTT